MTGVDMVHVAYADVGLVTSHLKSGKLRGLAVTSAGRSAAVPELPTVAEAGVPDYASGTWYGVLAPAGTPAPIVARRARQVGQGDPRRRDQART